MPSTIKPKISETKRRREKKRRDEPISRKAEKGKEVKGKNKSISEKRRVNDVEKRKIYI